MGAELLLLGWLLQGTAVGPVPAALHARGSHGSRAGLVGLGALKELLVLTPGGSYAVVVVVTVDFDFDFGVDSLLVTEVDLVALVAGFTESRRESWRPNTLRMATQQDGRTRGG